jgi:hypothetical protein
MLTLTGQQLQRLPSPPHTFKTSLDTGMAAVIASRREKKRPPSKSVVSA